MQLIVSITALLPFTTTLLLLTATSTATAAQQYSNTYMTCLVNKARQASGLSPLGMDDRLTEASQRHSDDMARMSNMDHTGSDGSSAGDRCQSAGFQWTAVAENIAYGQNGMDEVMQVWMDSPGHRENILNPQYTMMGSAVSMNGDTPYYTQDFACDGSGQAKNVPTCDGDYPDMGSAGQVSSGGGGGGGGGHQPQQQESSYGGDNGGGSNGGGMNGGGRRRQRSSNGRRPRNGQRQGGSYGGGQDQPMDMMASMDSGDDQWFADQGFGQQPSGGGRHPRYRNGGGGDMFGAGMFGGGGGGRQGGRGGFGGGGMGGGFGGFGGGMGGGMGGFY